MTVRYHSLLALLFLVVVFPHTTTADDFSSLGLEMVAGNLDLPVAITHAGDERLFITLQRGRVVIWDRDRILPQPFLDLTDRVGYNPSEEGMLSIAFHPNYSRNGFFFAFYNNLAGNTVVARYRVSTDPDVADRSSERILIEIAQPFRWHNGGQLQFGPDGYLYISSGDGGSLDDPQCRAQNGGTLLGKILRIDVDQNVDTAPYYGIPASNPFVGPGGPLDEIWALGLRNPWRFSIDHVTGDLFIGDVGQADREEVNYQPATGGGENYGWKMMEGTLCRDNQQGCAPSVPPCDDPAYTPPILEYAHGSGDCAVIGGYVYRGSRMPHLDGVYFYGDFCTGRIWAAERSGETWQAQTLAPRRQRLSCFGEDFEGELYLAAGNTVYRLTDRGTLAFTAESFSVEENAGSATITVRRRGGSGVVSVDYSTSDGTATAGTDYTSTSGTLAWTDGDETDKSFEVEIFTDDETEGYEFLNLELGNPGGGAVVGSPATAQLAIIDEDLPPETCVPDSTTLCLNQGRFRVDVSWRTAEGNSGAGTAEILTEDAGYFWFFSPNNPEVFVKVLNACVAPFNSYWVFAAGLTDVETRLTVVDTAGRSVRVYDKPLGVGFDPIRDTSAFPTCP